MNTTVNEKLLGAIARAYCHPKNSEKVLDPDLCLTIGESVRTMATSSDELEELKRAIACLRYELPEKICDDVEEKANKFFALFS